MKFCAIATVADSHPQALVLFRGLPESLRTIREIGYDGAELALFSSAKFDVKDTLKAARDLGLEIPAISTGQMFTMQGLAFTDPDPDVRRRAVTEFNKIVAVAGECGAQVNVSRIRGSIDPAKPYDQELARVSECLGEVCGSAARHGVTIVLEQMNRFETNYLNDLHTLSEYIDGLGIPNLKIHADTFHMNIEDADMVVALRDTAHNLGYIHFSDSNRLAPGAGHIRFDEIAAALDEIGYDSWIGIEALPIPDNRTAARDALAYVRSMEAYRDGSGQ